MFSNAAAKKIKRKITSLTLLEKGIPTTRSICLRTAFLYLFIGILWVYLTNSLLKKFITDPSMLNRIQQITGVAYVLFTSTVLYLFLKRDVQLILSLKDQVDLSTQEMRTIIENLTDGIWEYDFSSDTLHLSQKWKKTMGYTDQELDYRLAFIQHLIHPEDLKWFKKSIGTYLKSREMSYESELRIKTANGDYVWFLLRAQGSWDPQGKPIKITGTIINHHGRKCAEEIVVRSEKKFRKLFHNANDPIFLYKFHRDGTPGRYIEVNDVACQRLGYGRDTFLSLTPYDITSPNQVISSHETLEKLLHQDHITFETVLVTKDGQEVPYENNCHFFTLNGERVVLSISRDITERKRAEAQLKNIMNQNQKLLNETLEYDALKTEFFSNLSHEFKTPLNVILGALQLIYAKQGDRPKQNCVDISRDLNMIKQNCFRLLRLINNLIDITRVDTGFMNIQLENQNIVTIIEDITLSVAEFIESKGITLAFDTNVEEKIIACDADKIERIMLNLLSNAVKHTPPGGEIWVNILVQEKDVLVTVTDTGRGIPLDKQKIIFERFRQANPLLNRTHEGSGIGLSLTKSFVEMHNGKIVVDSTEGEGSQFTVVLPGDSIQSETSVTPIPTTFDSSKVEKIRIEFSDIYS